MKLMIQPLHLFVLGLTLTTSLAFGDVKNDDTGVNRLDLVANELTSEQQSPAKTDVQITRQIRQGIIADKKLSIYAHNVKIITGEGRVTLRGPVRSWAEESKVVKVAQSVAGPYRVIDKLQISQTKKIETYKRRIL